MKMEEIDEGTPSVFSSLPEGCISNIIALTSPKDACRESAVSWLFKSASESDTVWERFLPCDYRETVSRSVDSPPLKYATKKELFFSLCHTPVIINGGKLSFWLSKSSGKKCYMLCARELSIVLKNAPVHWSWRSVPESRFSEVAELVAVRWLEIRGRMQTQILSLKTTYAAYLVFSVTSDHYGLEEVARTFVGFSEDIDSAYNFAATVGHMSCLDVLEPESKPVYLLPEEAISPPAWQPRIPHPTSRTDGWMEILLGEFFNDEGEGYIDMLLWGIKNNYCKRGLIVQGIELRPKEDI